jgi:hypothetical protein
MPNDDELLQKDLQELLGRSKAPEATKNALVLLFPKLEKFLKTYLPVSMAQPDRGDQNRQHRIAQREFAHEYFGLSPNPLSWGRKELEDILDTENPSIALSKVTKRLNGVPERDQGRLRRQFLDALPGAFNSERKFSSQWLAALVGASREYLRMGDLTSSLLYHTENGQRLRMALFSAFRPLMPEERAEIFGSALPAAIDLSLLCSFFRTVVGDINPNGARGNRDADFFGARTMELRHQLLMRVKAAASSGLFWEQAEPSTLIAFWWGCDLEDEVRNFLNEEIRTDRGLDALLEVPLSRVYSTSGDYDSINLPFWSRVLDLARLAERAAELASLASIERKSKAIRFLEALRRGEEDPFSSNS